MPLVSNRKSKIVNRNFKVRFTILDLFGLWTLDVGFYLSNSPLLLVYFSPRLF